MKKRLSKVVALALAMGSIASVSLAEGSVLNVWCWNDEFQSRFNDYYPEVKEIAADKSTTTLNDGTIVKWTINPNENNNYQNKLDEALLAQDSAAEDDKIDIFLIEADYALKYVDSPYTLDVRADIGLTDDELAGQYKYTQDIASADGVLKGVTWQATPGLFAYRRSIAKDVLGTDDPAEVQTYLSDWDKFNEVAEKAAEKGYKMLSGYDDSYRTFSNNVSAPWVDGTTVKVDPNIMKWVEQTKEFTDKGYNNKSSLWNDVWAADQGPTGKVLAFSIPLGASTSPCWATPSLRRSLRAARKKSATASTATTLSAKDRRLTTGAAPGFALLPAPTTPQPSRTSWKS
ncbi:MAG: hypothetical protein V8Q79_02670 [Christensenellales bacterium]